MENLGGAQNKCKSSGQSPPFFFIRTYLPFSVWIQFTTLCSISFTLSWAATLFLSMYFLNLDQAPTENYYKIKRTKSQNKWNKIFFFQSWTCCFISHFHSPPFRQFHKHVQNFDSVHVSGEHPGLFNFIEWKKASRPGNWNVHVLKLVCPTGEL